MVSYPDKWLVLLPFMCSSVSCHELLTTRIKHHHEQYMPRSHAPMREAESGYGNCSNAREPKSASKVAGKTQDRKTIKGSVTEGTSPHGNVWQQSVMVSGLLLLCSIAPDQCWLINPQEYHNSCHSKLIPYPISPQWSKC